MPRFVTLLLHTVKLIVIVQATCKNGFGEESGLELRRDLLSLLFSCMLPRALVSSNMKKSEILIALANEPQW